MTSFQSNADARVGSMPRGCVTRSAVLRKNVLRKVRRGGSLVSETDEPPLMLAVTSTRSFWGRSPLRKQLLAGAGVKARRYKNPPKSSVRLTTPFSPLPILIVSDLYETEENSWVPPISSEYILANPPSRSQPNGRREQPETQRRDASELKWTRYVPYSHRHAIVLCLNFNFSHNQVARQTPMENHESGDYCVQRQMYV